MIYGYVAIDSYIHNDWDTDYQSTAVADVKKSPLIFKWKRERDASAETECVKSHFRFEIEKFTTKSNQGKLKIIPYKEYDNMVNEINRLEEEVHKLKNNE